MAITEYGKLASRVRGGKESPEFGSRRGTSDGMGPRSDEGVEGVDL